MIKEFQQDKRDGSVQGNLLEAFYSRTRDAAHLEKHRPIEKLHLEKPAPGFKKPATKLSLKQTQLIPQIRKNPKPENQKPNADLLPVNQSFVYDPDSVRGTKRHSASQDTLQSSQYVRTPNKRRQQPQVTDRYFSCKLSDPTHSFFNSSTITNAPTIFTGQEDVSFTTVATSFNASDNESEDSSSAEYGDLDLSQADKLMVSFDQEADIEPERQEDSLVEVQKPSDSLLKPSPFSDQTRAANAQLQMENEAALQAPAISTKTALEHRLVRSLPTDGLFCQPIEVDVKHSSFYSLWESYRVATTSGTSFEYHTSKNDLYKDPPSRIQSL